MGKYGARKRQHQRQVIGRQKLRRQQLRNERSQHDGGHLVCLEKPGGDLESRKRTRRQLEFMHPPPKCARSVPYVFQRKGKAVNREKLCIGKSAQAVKVIGGDPTKENKGSIDDTFQKGKYGQIGWETKRDSAPATGPDQTTMRLEGKLSGLSVEDAMMDRTGLRPRANSTDGELNLPRRGLCDERMVLQSHRWRHPTMMQGRSPTGFSNMGNTCFLNSTLQCLAYLPPFCQSLLAIPEKDKFFNGKENSQGKRITWLLRSLFQKIEEASGGEGAISPRDVVEALPSLGNSGGRYGGYTFRKGRQEDAHEFLVHLLDAMHDGELRDAGINQRMSGWRDRLPTPRLDETTFLHRIFGGYLRSQLQCPKCNYCSNTYDPFLDLALEVSSKAIKSVADAFFEFTKKETLDSDNRWRCGGCSQHVRAKKALTVFRPPLSLCVQMKRFAFGSLNSGFQARNRFGGGGHGNKITKAIAFPAEMKLPLSDSRSCEYTLTGVVIHVGGSSDSGHYTAYVRKPGVGKSEWYHMDDSYVQAVSEKTVVEQRNAYLLFYCRKEVKLEFPSPPSNPGYRSMSTEEATVLGRARARARADSLTHGAAMEPSTANPAATSKNDPPKRIAKHSLKASPANSSIQSAAKSPDKPANNVVKGGEKKATSGEPRSFLQEEDNSSDTSSYGDSKGDRDGDGFRSSDDHDPEDNDEEHEEQSDQGAYAHDRKRVNGNFKWHSPCVRKNQALRSTIKAEIFDSKLTSTSSIHSDSTCSETEEPTEFGKAIMAKAAKVRSVKSSLLNWMAVPESDARRDARKSVEKKQMSPVTTSVLLLDRGRGREKVSVMVGPKFKTRKGWRPQTCGTPKRGEEYNLLGNRTIGKWEDGLGTLNDASKVRLKIVNVMAKRSKVEKRKQFPDGWDASLDRGRLKKVKPNQEYRNDNGGGNNSFQRILTGLQKMKHRRAAEGH